jgi:hypothetical protein
MATVLDVVETHMDDRWLSVEEIAGRCAGTRRRVMAKLLSERNPFLRDPEKKKRLLISAIGSSQRQEGIEITEARAEEVYKIVFEEPPIAFFRLTQAGDAREKLFVQSLYDAAAGVRFDVSRREILAVDQAPLAYWVPNDVMYLFRALPSLYPAFGEAQQGVITGDDAPYFRFFWEVVPRLEARPWKPLHKGGDFSRFFYDADLVIDWSAKAQKTFHRLRDPAIYFRSGLTWPRRTQRGFNVRAMPRGCVFSDKGPAFLVKDARDFDYLLGVLNSSMAEYLCRALMSFGSYQLRAVHELPIPRPPTASNGKLAATARGIHDAKAAWDEGNEISTRFKEPWLAIDLREHPDRPLAAALDAVLAREAAADAEVQAWYADLDAAVFDAYGLSAETRAAVLENLGPRSPELIWPQMEGKSPDQKRLEHVVRLLSFCVKNIMEGNDAGIVPLVACNNEPPLEKRVLAELGTLVGADRMHLLEGELASELRKRVPGFRRADSIGDFLASGWFEHHVRLYKNRPVFWHLASVREGGGTPAFAALVHYHRFGKDALRKLRGSYLRSFLERLERELAQARRANRIDDALEIQRGLEEARAFDQKLQGLEEGRYPLYVPWKEAGKQPKGWEPDVDDGVKVNILPLQAAGLLRIPRVVTARGAEDDG